MWKYFIRPLFFLFDPELVHNFLIKWTKLLGGAGSPDMRFTSPLLEKKVFGYGVLRVGGFEGLEVRGDGGLGDSNLGTLGVWGIRGVRGF